MMVLRLHEGLRTALAHTPRAHQVRKEARRRALGTMHVVLRLLIGRFLCNNSACTVQEQHTDLARGSRLDVAVS